MHFANMPFIAGHNAVQNGMANNLIYTSEIHLYPLNREGVKKIMTNDEFREIHEAWTELKTCFDEIDACNAEEALGKFGTNAAQTAFAQ